MSIEVEEFLEVIKDCKTKTPKTYEFDVTNKLGQGYDGKGSINDRWWDEIGDDCEYFSNQKYHIYGTFRCAAYHDGIINPKCKTAKECEECYKNGFSNYSNNDLSKSNLNDNFLQTKFNGMGRPEMYLWFVEAFGLLEGEKLNNFVKAITKLFENKKETKTQTLNAEVRRILREPPYKITWDTVAKKANKIVAEKKKK